LGEGVRGTGKEPSKPREEKTLLPEGQNGFEEKGRGEKQKKGLFDEQRGGGGEKEHMVREDSFFAGKNPLLGGRPQEATRKGRVPSFSKERAIGAGQ